MSYSGEPPLGSVDLVPGIKYNINSDKESFIHHMSLLMQAKLWDWCDTDVTVIAFEIQARVQLDVNFKLTCTTYYPFVE